MLPVTAVSLFVDGLARARNVAGTTGSEIPDRRKAEAHRRAATPRGLRLFGNPPRR